ncbi:hypothetical protein AAFF_G00334000 [Aldrovandia affinis]|uniref:MIF4G domain-containing protein n=1 Tax=Aldrovandia affinis TaxID=143900 RepID=A0AAD7R6J9_9TELE|nr:hypothetical protein AAFF_G00334000 [Aldrovandia affinis]
MMQDRQRKVQEIRQCVELSRSSTQREIEDSVEVFSALMRSIEVGQAVLTDVMGEKQRALEQRAEGLIKDLEQELTELQKRNTELEKLSNTEDHLHFLQSFPALCTPPPTKDWSDTSVHTDVCVESVRSVMSHLEDSLTEQMGKLRDKAGWGTMVPKEPPREMQGRQKHRKGQKAETKALYWQVRGIVETVSQQTFRQAMKRMSDLTINTEHKLRIVVEHIYEKAVSNPATAVVCANMARCLVGMKVPLADNPGRTLNLRNLLLNRCQKEFQRGLDKDEDDDDDETASRVWEEAEAHQRWLRNIAFICELFKLKMLTEAIVHDCIVHMLKGHREHLLEGLCCLLSTIGKDFDSQKAKPRMDQYYNQLENIVKTGTVSPRIRSMVQEVLNLRRSGFHT